MRSRRASQRLSLTAGIARVMTAYVLLPLMMRALVAVAVTVVGACSPAAPPEQYGFVALLGRDTISVERVARQGNWLTIDGVDRFPRVRQRHTRLELGDDGGIKHLTMDIHTPSEPANQQDRQVVVDVTSDSVRIVKRDQAGTLRRAFAAGGRTAIAHVPQMYSLYEVYFMAALRKAAGVPPGPADTVRLTQFYIDREFDQYRLHSGVVKVLPAGKAEIVHDWLAGIGDAELDSAGRLLEYSGARTTYKVAASRVEDPPDVQAIGARLAAEESARGGVRQLSVRDTARASIGSATFAVDYGRPLARGRTLLGGILPYDQLWRTGANAATQFTTSVPITLGGLAVPAGTYTLWTIPRVNGADLIVNKQTGNWGTSYDAAQDLGRTTMTADSVATPVETFTIAVQATDDRRGALTMEWGSFRWKAPILVHTARPSS